MPHPTASNIWSLLHDDAGRGSFENTSLTGDHAGTLTLFSANGDAQAGAYVSPVISTLAGDALTVRWLPRWTTPVTWRRHGGNPVLTSAAEPAWDAGPVIGPCVLQLGDTLRMYYGARPSGIGFAETTLDRLHDWKRHGKPILTAGQGNAFDANGVNAPKVLPITDTHWHMYYVGYHPNATSNGAPVHQIGLAESDDAGLTWRQYPDPIIPRGESADDVFSTSSASVLRVGEQWYLWYTAIAQVPYLASICLATSSDGGHTWTKYDRNPVLRFNPYLQAESFVLAKPHMLYEDGLFKMWYSAKGFGEGTSLGDYRVCYAESIDGMTWERFPGNPVLRPTDSGWDSTMVEYAEVAHIDDKYHMWYCGDGYGQIGYAQGEHASRVEVCIRSGRTAKPDATWSDWSQPLTDPPGTRYNVGEAHAGSSNNHVQMRVTLVASGSPSPPRVEGLWIDSVKTSSP